MRIKGLVVRCDFCKQDSYIGAGRLAGYSIKSQLVTHDNIAEVARNMVKETQEWFDHNKETCCDLCFVRMTNADPNVRSDTINVEFVTTLVDLLAQRKMV